MPAEPAQNSALLKRCAAVAYWAEELGGLIFAFFGPDPAPLLPRWDLLAWEDGLRDIGRALIPCNWLQIMENSVDATHVEWLHGRYLAWSRERAGLAAPTHYRKHQIKIGFDASGAGCGAGCGDERTALVTVGEVASLGDRALLHICEIDSAPGEHRAGLDHRSGHDSARLYLRDRTPPAAACGVI